MKRLIALVTAGVAISLTACEKKEGEPKSAVDSITGAVGDAAKQAGETAKDAAAKATDAAKDMGGKIDEMVKGGSASMVEKLNTMMAEWKPTVESLKGKVASAPEAVKPAIESAVKGIEEQWKSVEGAVAKLKDAPVDQLKALGTDAFSGAEKLGTMIKDAAAKYLK